MEPLQAEKLARDPRVTEAKRLLIEALSEHQRPLSGVRPPHADRKPSYQEILKRLREMRGNPLFYPYVGSGLGHGPWVELADGSVKYDFISGIGVHFLGHNHPGLLAAGVDAALQNTVMQGHLQQNLDGMELLERVLQGANRRGARFAHGVISSSGAMANENALKIAFQKRSPAARILAFQHCFAGRTLALSQITDKPAYRQGLPATVAVDYVPFFDASRPEASLAASLAALKAHLAAHPGEHAAMFFELIQGEGGGYAVGTTEFFRTLMGAARQGGATIVADEIQTFGRTEELFAFQTFGLDDLVDMATFGKMTQACGTVFTAELCPKPGLISQTYTTSTSAIRSGLAVVKILLEKDYLGPQGRIAKVSSRLRNGLMDLERRHPEWVRGPYGLGAMIAFTPFDGNADKAAKLGQAMFENGVIAFTAGADPTRMRFLPPVGAVEDVHVDEVLAILESTLETMA